VRRVALDTSVVVTALVAVHERHAVARHFVEDAFRDGAGVIMPAPVLFEAYSVVTRMPSPWRLRADVAERVLRETFAERATVVALPSGDRTWSIMRKLAQAGLAGGIAHDAHVAACALEGGATELATFNLRDFARLDLEGMTLIVP
jgi:predicted nucleic acid-binding protein